MKENERERNIDMDKPKETFKLADTSDVMSRAHQPTAKSHLNASS